MTHTRKISVQRRLPSFPKAHTCAFAGTLLLILAVAISSAHAKTADEWQAEGTASYKNKKHAEAVKACAEALKLNPDHLDALRYRGLARYVLKDHPGTIHDWDRYIALKGEDAPAFAYFNRGLAEIALEDHRQAFSDFDMAAKKKKDYAFAINNRGRCRQALGDYEGAFEDYSEALKLKPGNKTILDRIDSLEKDVEAAKGMNPSPALREIMGAKISVLDLYLDDIRAAGAVAFNSGDDPFNPILESIDYDPIRDRVIMFFTLDPSDDYARMFDTAASDWKRNILEKEADTLAVIAGCAPLDETGERFGLLQLTPFRGVTEVSRGSTARVKNEIAGKTVIVVQMQRGNKTYFASRNPDGRTQFKEAL